MSFTEFMAEKIPVKRMWLFAQMTILIFVGAYLLTNPPVDEPTFSSIGLDTESAEVELYCIAKTQGRSLAEIAVIAGAAFDPDTGLDVIRLADGVEYAWFEACP